ncbi:MAG: ABC transporter permease subunit [Chthoniobacteraceae bacterium]
MKTLLRKEMRAQLPFALLMGFLALLELSDSIFNEYPDRRPLAVISQEATTAGMLGFLYVALAVSLGLALLPRERDEGTLEFLDALPCSRWQVFMSKAVAGALILGLYPLFDNSVALLLHRLAHTSLDPAWPWEWIGKMFFVEWFMLIAILGVGLALSFLRRFAFLAVGALVGVWLALDSMSVPAIGLFNFSRVFGYTFREGRMDIPWQSLGAFGSLGGLGYLLAYLIFRAQGDRAARMIGWLQRSHLKGPLIAAGTIAMIAVWMGVIGMISPNKDNTAEADPNAVTYAPAKISRLQSPSFIFLYPANLRERAAALAERSSAVHEKVRAFFDAEPAGEIVVDLDSRLRHVLATANWKRVNMSIVDTPELDEQAAVLGHELTHVYIDAVSDGRLKKVPNSARFFHEGLATFVEYQLFRPPAAIFAQHLAAAAAYQRKSAEFEKLIDDSAWRVEHDPNLAYPLGEIFIEALVEVYGEKAPAAVLRSLARPDAPEKLSGLDLWRDALQAKGWDLSRVTTAYYRRLRDLAESEMKDELEALPRLRGRVVPENDFVTIQAIHEGTLPDGARLACRVRKTPAAADYEYMDLNESKPGEFRLARSLLGEGEFWYQLGIEHPRTWHVIYENWERARLD